MSIEVVLLEREFLEAPLTHRALVWVLLAMYFMCWDLRIVTTVERVGLPAVLLPPLPCCVA